MPMGKVIVMAGIIVMMGWALREHRVGLVSGVSRVGPPVVEPFVRAEAHYHTFKYDEAVAAYREAIEAGVDEPRRREAHFRMAIALDKSGNRAQSLEAYQLAVKLYPGSDDAGRAGPVMERL